MAHRAVLGLCFGICREKGGVSQYRSDKYAGTVLDVVDTIPGLFYILHFCMES